MIFREDRIYYSRLIESGEWCSTRQMYSWIAVPPGKALCGCVVKVESDPLGRGWSTTRYKADESCPACGGGGAS